MKEYMPENNIEYSKGITRENHSEDKCIPEEKKKEKALGHPMNGVRQSMRCMEHIVGCNRWEYKKYCSMRLRRILL